MSLKVGEARMGRGERGVELQDVVRRWARLEEMSGQEREDGIGDEAHRVDGKEDQASNSEEVDLFNEQKTDTQY